MDKLKELKELVDKKKHELNEMKNRGCHINEINKIENDINSLEEEIKKGNFRADLFYRLNVIPITLPPLRERLEDVPALVTDLMEVFVAKGFSSRLFTPKALAAMQCHDWPGNVRELRNFLERLLIMCPEEEIDAQQVTALLGNSTAVAQGPNVPKGASLAAYDDVPFKEAKKRFEADFLRERLAAHDGNISQTAEEIGMERSHLHKKIKALGLT